MAGAHPTASLSLCFAVILKGQREWGGFHSPTECPELKAPTRIIESSSSVHGPHRDQSHSLGVISPCCDQRKPRVTQFLPHSTQTLKPLCFLGSQRTPWQPQQEPSLMAQLHQGGTARPRSSSQAAFLGSVWDFSRDGCCGNSSSSADARSCCPMALHRLPKDTRAGLLLPP